MIGGIDEASSKRGRWARRGGMGRAAGNGGPTWGPMTMRGGRVSSNESDRSRDGGSLRAAQRSSEVERPGPALLAKEGEEVVEFHRPPVLAAPEPQRHRPRLDLALSDD